MEREKEGRAAVELKVRVLEEAVVDKEEEISRLENSIVEVEKFLRDRDESIRKLQGEVKEV